MAHLRSWLGAAGCVVLLAGCGDGLVDRSYRGQVLWQIAGVVAQSDGPTPDTSGLRIALFWSPRGEGDSDLEDYVEQVSTSIPAQLPAAFQLNVFDAPPAAALIPAQGAHPAYGLGRLVAYLDRNQNGRRDGGEPVAGLGVAFAYVYAPTDLAAGATLATGAFTAGFHQVLLPQLCGMAPIQPQTPGTCGVPLGAPCHSDQDCGGGQCLEQTGILWPDGACAVFEPPLQGCRPAAAQYFPFPVGNGGPIGYYLKPCSSDSDCVRSVDRMAGAYVCDPGLRACVPSAMVNVTIGSDAPVIPFCG